MGHNWSGFCDKYHLHIQYDHFGFLDCFPFRRPIQEYVDGMGSLFSWGPWDFLRIRNLQCYDGVHPLVGPWGVDNHVELQIEPKWFRSSSSDNEHVHPCLHGASGYQLHLLFSCRQLPRRKQIKDGQKVRNSLLHLLPIHNNNRMHSFWYPQP